MIIERIELNHFRNYEKLSLFPHEEINIFFGENGSGKTNLLEAIHYCSLGKSHRMNQDLNTVMMNQPGASCHLWIQNYFSRNEIEIRLRPDEESVKSVWIDQKRAARLSEMMGVLRCVIFSPEDLELVRGGPAVRRRFLDMMISQISKSYFIALQQYRVALNQRNAILKKARTDGNRPSPVIEDFEKSMSEQAQLIYMERNKYTDLLAELAKEIYQKISGQKQEDFSMIYHPSVKCNSDEPFNMEKLLEESREEDLRQGMTTLGPQRDDISLTLNHRSMKLYASQGQIRTAALSMKLGQLFVIRKVTGDSPVLLLDDVMSELDLNRRMNLLEMMNGIQTFITCSDEGDLAEYQNHRTYQVLSEQGKAQMRMIKNGPEKNSAVLKEPVFE